jgi:hypothetical protein
MPENASRPVEPRSKNPFDVPKGRWKIYAGLTLLALTMTLIGVALGISLFTVVGLMATLFLAIGIAYSFMNEKGL